MGKYLSSINQVSEANESFKQAYYLYMQWGANAKANQVLKDHNLSISEGNMEQNNLKHDREW